MALKSPAARWFKVLCWSSVLSVGALVVLGGIVRVTGSGLGCPDWPLCHGKFFPPLELQPVIEYSHRLVASAVVGPIVLATCVAAWITQRRDRWIVVTASVAVVLLIGQALLGGVTVLTELPGGIVAAHLALAEALLATLIVLLVVSHRGPLIWDGLSRRFPVLMLAAALAVYALILTGSFVTAAGATAACTTWPLCQGNVFPQSTFQAINMGHRLATLVFGLYVLYALHLGFRGKNRPGGVKFLAMAATIILAMQVAAGAATVWLDFAIGLRALHLSLATALWGLLAGLAALSHTSPSADPDAGLTAGNREPLSG
jgi:heme A synthase